MNRRPLLIPCEGAAMAATLDEADGGTGLLLVSGGNEIRSGSWAGQAQLAARIAAAGYPVLRFDRRGIGDSEGENAGFRGAQADIAAALEAFSGAQPQLRRVVAFGNCDAASALMLAGDCLQLDGLVLANPWVIEAGNETVQAPAAIRRRYAEKLLDPKEWLRLLRGGVNIGKLLKGLRQAGGPAPVSSLAGTMQAELAQFAGPVTILLAGRDRTAELFAAAWPADDPRIHTIDSASHSFSDVPAREWLLRRLVEAIDEIDGGRAG